MHDDQLLDRLGSDLAALVRDVDASLVGADQITSMPANTGTRGSWRLRFADGRTLKGRCFESAARAAQVATLREALTTSPFVDVVDHRGAAMLEEWVDGEVLDAAATTLDQARASGRMLGQLHACTPPIGVLRDGEIDRGATWMRRIREHLGVLLDAKAVTPDLAAAIDACAAAHTPTEVRTGIVHRDLCPDNIVVDAGGALRWVDAGTLTVGAIDEDLCRVWYRWPMLAAHREAFIEGYAEAGPGDATMLRRPSEFWLIVVLCGSARYRLAGGQDVATIVTTLERIIDRAGRGLGLTFRGLHIDVRGNARDATRWLDEFVTPHLHDDAATTARCELTVTVDTDRYAAIRASPGAAGHTPREVDCFTLDGSFVRLPLWAHDADGLVVHDREAGVFVAIGDADESGGRRVDVLAERDTRRMRLTLMRVVRELATMQAVARGDLHVHGATVVVDGRAFVIAGGKRAGKTSMLLNALSQPGVAYLSNDRVLLERTSTGVLVRGMPTIVKVRPGSFDHLPKLPPMGWQRPCVSIRECERGGPLADDASHRAGSMSPAQLVAWLGVAAVDAAPLAAVVLPRVDDAIDGFDVRVVDAAEAATRLEACVLGADTPAGPPEAFGSGSRVGEPAVDVAAACAAIAADFACLDCRIGPRAFETPNVWRAIVTSPKLR